MESLLLTLFVPLDSSFTSVSFLFFLVELTISFLIFSSCYSSTIARHCRLLVTMATMSQRALCDEVVDRSSASSVAADAHDCDVPKCVLHDGAVSSELHVEKKIVGPVFEGTASLRQPCCYDKSCDYGGNRESFERSWPSDDEETVEMAALVPEWFRIEMSNKNENVDLFAHVAYWQEGPKATPIEEEKWWWAY